MNLVSDCNGLTQDVSKDKWELRSSDIPNESKQEISMLRSCFEKGNHYDNHHNNWTPSSLVLNNQNNQFDNNQAIYNIKDAKLPIATIQRATANLEG